MTVDTKKVVRVDGLARAITASLNATIGKADTGRALTRDDAKGEYTNIAEYWKAHRTGAVYGVQKPKWAASNSPACVKTRDNTGLVLEKSTNTTAGRDDYRALNAFQCMNVNATVGDDGKPHVTAIEGYDQHYDQYGRNGLVWIMTPPLYYAVRETSTSLEILISDSKWTGFSPMPGLLLPDGTERACMLHAKYMAGLDANGKPTSWSGIQPSRDFGCQNDYIDRAAKLGKGYSGLVSADVAYIQIMLMMKYGTTNSDVLGGMFNHSKQATVTKGESNAHRVIVSTADAAGFDIDNYVNVGTDGERNNTGNHSVAECRRIIGKTVIDATNTALDLDGDAITTINPTGNLKDYVSVMPYRTGATDRILGTDGIPHGELNILHQPVKLQNIELFCGMYEGEQDTLIKAVKDSDTAGHCELWKTYDTTKANKTAITADYTHIGDFPAFTDKTSGQWLYGQDISIAAGIPLPVGTGASSATGLCDAIVGDPVKQPGIKMHRRFGDLWDGARCGAFCSLLWDVPANRRWLAGGRLSALGRSKA